MSTLCFLKSSMSSLLSDVKDSPREQEPNSNSVDDSGSPKPGRLNHLEDDDWIDAPSKSQSKSPVRHKAVLPKTAAFLLFRNADRTHRGEALLVKRWPPPSLEQLLVQCGEVCHPFIGPITAIYTIDLKPVKSLEEVQPGSYLVKGREECLEPPVLFDSKFEGSSPSLRALSKARSTSAMELDTRMRPSSRGTSKRRDYSPQGSATSFLEGSSLESRPWSSASFRDRPPPSRCRKWKASDRLAMTMTWGGLGPLPQHVAWEEWQPVLSSAEKEDCFSAADESFRDGYVQPT